MSVDAPAPGPARYDLHNAALLVIVAAGWLALLALASRSGPAGLAGCLVAFAMLGLPLDGLMHEGFHGNLHHDPATNRRWGTLACWLFPGSFTLLRLSHDGHHRNNRTDHEMFDLYYEDDNRLLKAGQWYGNLVGLYAVSIPLLSVGVALFPRLVTSRPFARAKTTGPLFGQGRITPVVVRRVRLEVAGGVLFWAGAGWLLSLEAWVVLASLAAFWLNWSTRQYLGHAFCPRDVVHGACNLKVSRLHAAWQLHRNLELTHHEHPGARWQELPRLARHSAHWRGYWRQWLRSWGGPRPNTEPAPAPLPPGGLP